MPYPRAHYYVLVVIAVIAAGFWPSYFGAWDAAPWQFHAHGIAASLWVIMVFAQSWTAHHRQIPLHRAIGKASLLLFPFLIGGLAAIIDVTAKGFVANADPVRQMFGGSFLIGMAVAMAAYVTVYYRALKYRRKVWTHAGYMLTTPLILFESPFGRILNMFMPGLIVTGPDTLGLIMTAILWSMALELMLIAVVGKAAPFLVAGGREISGKGGAFPRCGRVHRGADRDHGMAGRPACAEEPADGVGAGAEPGGLGRRLRDRGADQLGRLEGGPTHAARRSGHAAGLNRPRGLPAGAQGG